MKQKYTTAFIGITLSGEVYIIRQFRGTLLECAQWRKENRDEVKRLYGEVRETTLEHPQRLTLPSL